MEPIVILAVLVILAIAAPRWGRDSRAGVRSKEQELAATGVRWPGGPGRGQLATRNSARGRPRPDGQRQNAA
jgi:hypothetical protein